MRSWDSGRSAWIVVVIMVCFLSGCQPPGGGYWTSWIPGYTWRVYDPYSTPAVQADGSLYVFQGNLLRHYSASRAFVSEVAVPVSYYPKISPSPFELRSTSAGRLYLASREEVTALDLSGNVLWQEKDLYYGEGSLVAFDDGAFYIAMEGSLWLAQFRGNDGDLLWSEEIPGSSYKLGVAVVGRDLFVVAGSNIILALDGQGQEIYRETVPGMESSDYPYLAACDNRAAVACREGVYLFEDGELQWQQPIYGEYGRFGPVVMPSRDRVVAYYEGAYSTGYYAVYAYDAETGGQIALNTVENCFSVTPAANGYTTFENAENNRYLSLYSASDGTKRWESKIKQYSSEAVKHEGQIVEFHTGYFEPMMNNSGGFFVIEDGSIVELDANGNKVWEQPSTRFTDEYIEGHYSGAY